MMLKIFVIRSFGTKYVEQYGVGTASAYFDYVQGSIIRSSGSLLRGRYLPQALTLMMLKVLSSGILVLRYVEPTASAYLGDVQGSIMRSSGTPLRGGYCGLSRGRLAPRAARSHVYGWVCFKVCRWRQPDPQPDIKRTGNRQVHITVDTAGY